MPANENLVIVIDPGHGGKQSGLDYNGLVEKEMNLVTANAMRDELLQYNGVEVYITNPESETMTLKERAQYAESVEADILVCLHFNMSENHEMYGSEVWIPSTGLGNSKMHALGDIFMEQFSEQGFTLRGVKTRLNDEGRDYYGIIRESAALDIPCILVEHGYADHEMDFEKVDSVEDWQALGRSDATAVAKYYGLTSGSLSKDYSDYVKNGYFAPRQATGVDTTSPENPVLIREGSSEEGEHFLLSASDAESGLVYYDYTVDGGTTWSKILPFDSGKTSMSLVIPEAGPGSKVCARVYNGFFRKAETNVIVYDDLQQLEVVEKVRDTAAARQEGREYMIYSLFGFFMCVLLFVTAYVTYRERMRLRRQRIYGGQRRTTGSFSIGRLRRIENASFLMGLCVLLVSATLLAAGLLRRNQFDEVYITRTERVEADKPVTSEELLQLHEKNVLLGEEQETVIVYDIAEGYLRVPLLPDVERNPYDLSGFSGENLEKAYVGNDGIKTMTGVDVSKFQGDIDWQQVKESGVEYAILRLGIRGYGSGELIMDDRFYENYRGATEAGIKTGVYFFSAAISEQEALEEAEFVINALADCEIQMPVVFDTEPILYDDARTDDLTPDELTIITKTFCQRIKEAGYTPMIYANAKRFTTVLHLEELEEYDKWLADYRSTPDYPYDFSMWQFTEKGSVPGIEGNVDIDLYFYKE